uniref:Uncharacterized protein n=1 Tax=Oxyrrhis marina TaxID=2969 RepID=A0A6U9JLD4_OXYMA|mmetsp:Transcript_17423/g.44275  ORF Transcript_17423/g.44275 Transcript_17423/m.44275 type:complete len:107 (-) Transcript_17423:81-401(-)
MEAIGSLIKGAQQQVSAFNVSKATALRVIKTGTFCRTVVWPILPPLMLYQYIREKDVDMFALELLYDKSGSNEPAAFYNRNLPGVAKHWKVQSDLEFIRQAANPEQ